MERNNTAIRMTGKKLRKPKKIFELLVMMNSLHKVNLIFRISRPGLNAACQ